MCHEVKASQEAAEQAEIEARAQQLGIRAAELPSTPPWQDAELAQAEQEAEAGEES